MTQDDHDVLNLFDNFYLLENLFDKVRLVDPNKNKILNYRNDAVTCSNENCFDVWGKHQICKNCISLRALKEDQTFVKLDYSFAGVVYLAAAIPVFLNGNRVIVELLKNITHSLIVEGEPVETRANAEHLLESMKALVMKDALTGIFNRRYIDEKLPSDILHAIHTQGNLSLIMADIDLFKKVNDTYGHLAGDEVLKAFAKTLMNSLRRDTDWVARYGGEEFIICLPGAKQKQTVEFANTIRKAVEETTIPFGSNIIKITASFGICSMNALETKDMNSMLTYADEKLYLAKQNGRNRVEF